MSKYAINPNKLPDIAAEERAALEREQAFETDDATGEGNAGGEPLPPAMFVPDPRYPHGDVDAIEARLAELKKTGASMAAAATPTPAETAPKPLRAQDNPLILSLIAELPAPDSVWSAADRADWLRAAESLFHLVYRADEKVDVLARRA
jgi:hypothetical protein